jgi:8-oxo-dGTP pyrophosphatase MutT (NUDIX family)
MAIISHDSETPAQGQQVISAVAFIHHDFDGVTKLFTARRAATKKFLPDVFEMPGGHIDYGEDIRAGLEREIMEEFGMRVSLGDAFETFTYLNEIKGSHSIEVVFFGTFLDPIDVIQLNPEDHSEYRWIAESEVDDITNALKSADDPEIQAIRKGFRLLRGEQPSFG